MDQKAKLPSKLSHSEFIVYGTHFSLSFKTKTFLLTEINLEDLVGGARPIWDCLQ